MFDNVSADESEQILQQLVRICQIPPSTGIYITLTETDGGCQQWDWGAGSCLGFTKALNDPGSAVNAIIQSRLDRGISTVVRGHGQAAFRTFPCVPPFDRTAPAETSFQLSNSTIS